MRSIRPPGDAYLENDQLRFVPGREGTGVIYFQAAVRVNSSDQDDIMKGPLKQVAFADALKTLSLQPVEKMLIQPTEPTSVSADTRGSSESLDNEGI